jgi:hypothetical protein
VIYPLKENYLCPHCHSYLRVWNNIILIAKSELSNQQGILLFNAEVGNYDLIHHSSLKFVDGEIVNIICPVCKADLTASEINENLVRIVMTDENKKTYDIYFSKIFGEHSTFVIQEENIIERRGEDSSNYLSYFQSKLKKRFPN